MEKERKIKVLSVAALLVAVLGLTVAFAALSQTLTINGSATVNAASWDVHFENLSEATIEGGAEVVTKPTITEDGTSIQTFKVKLTKPLDSVIYTFDVKNAGSINAKLTGITKAATPTCTGSGDSATTDAEKVCSGLTYKLTYADGDHRGEEVSTANSDLAAGASAKLQLELSFDIESDVAVDIAKNDVEISGLDIALTYGQN